LFGGNRQPRIGEKSSSGFNAIWYVERVE